eukprot:TRINITY_DN7510_c0_g1_i2.p1 TRINITY_DN7510_c0_g1~~TRINITY_DN7510_c0_g1_i2.p1  ORF type:complete len:128 (+),score=14.56 TRINITY_DN7510_c0_g1_i2:27-410(+)
MKIVIILLLILQLAQSSITGKFYNYNTDPVPNFEIPAPNQSITGPIDFTWPTPPSTGNTCYIDFIVGFVCDRYIGNLVVSTTDTYTITLEWIGAGGGRVYIDNMLLLNSSFTAGGTTNSSASGTIIC